MQAYLATMPLEMYQPPFNHGLVDLTDEGFVNGETPLEDFGAYILSSCPLPQSEEELFFLFYSKIKESDSHSENG